MARRCGDDCVAYEKTATTTCRLLAALERATAPKKGSAPVHAEPPKVKF